MAGSKTRFGFLGSGDEPPDSGESGAARTIIGHDIHLQKLPSGFEPSRPLGSPTPIPPARVPYTPVRPAAVGAPIPGTITEAVPVRQRYRPQQSRLARFLGRCTTGGHFHSRSSRGQATLLDDSDERDLEVPRDTTGRNVALVLGIAVLTFLVTFALVRIRQRYAIAQPAAGAQVVESPTTAPPLPTQPAQARAPAAPPPAPAEKPALLGTPAELPTPKDRPRPHKPARTSVPTGQPPDHLKGELLPPSP
jgi:hypothetical protein